MTDLDNTEDLKTIDSIIKRTRFASVTTRTADGDLVSRPLAVLEHDFEGTVWFFTQHPSQKTGDIGFDAHVNVTYVDGENVVSLAGTATVSRDQTRIDEFWNPWAEAWFENGKDDPTLALLEVQASSIQYWHVDKPAIVRGFEIVRAIVTGSTPDVAENKIVEL